MQNTLLDLNNHLFAQLERLSDEDLREAELECEINRARAICSVSSQIIANGQLVLKAEELRYESGEKVPEFLEGGKKCITDTAQKRRNG